MINVSYKKLLVIIMTI